MAPVVRGGPTGFGLLLRYRLVFVGLRTGVDRWVFSLHIEGGDVRVRSFPFRLLPLGQGKQSAET